MSVVLKFRMGADNRLRKWAATFNHYMDTDPLKAAPYLRIEVPEQFHKDIKEMYVNNRFRNIHTPK